MRLAAALLFAVAFVYAAEAPPFDWRGAIPSGGTLEVKGINGEIRIEPSTASDVHVSARITAERSDPNQVRVNVVPTAGGVQICAIYPTDEPSAGCDQRGNIRNNDTKVNFTVRMPRGVNLTATTVNGGISGRGLQSPVNARTVNGTIDVTTSEAATGKTVNGNITLEMGQLPAEAKFETVNGNITIGLPPTTNANINASVVNGSIQPDFPLTLTGAISGKKINGRINNGGPEIALKTVNGNINIRRSGAI